MSILPCVSARPARWVTGLLAPLACAALAVASSSAQALSAQAELDWSGFSISVVDIDATDGINASYSFDSHSSRTASCFDGSSICPGLSGPAAEDWISHAHYADSIGQLWGAASYSAGNLLAAAVGANPSGERGMTASRSALLMLDGASEVTITLPYSLAVDATGGDSLHTGFAYAGLIVSSVGIVNSQLSTPTDGTTSSNQVLRLQWTNHSDHAVSYMGADAMAELVAPPVPEPGSLALMAGGMALLAARWRTRRSSAPQAQGLARSA